MSAARSIHITAISLSVFTRTTEVELKDLMLLNLTKKEQINLLFGEKCRLYFMLNTAIDGTKEKRKRIWKWGYNDFTDPGVIETL